MSARIVIAGGGLAGVEAALGLKELAPADTRITIVAPATELAHQVLDAPWTMSGIVRHPLAMVCERLGVELVRDAVVGVDLDARTLALHSGATLPYDELLVAVGARRVMSLDHAVVFGSALDVPAVQQLRELVTSGEAKRVVTVVPPGAAWSLPSYEAALRGADAGAEAVVVTPEARPLEVFGAAAEAVDRVLQDAGVQVVRGALPTPDGALWLEHDLSSGQARSAGEPLWDPPSRIAGVRLPAFLASLNA